MSDLERAAASLAARLPEPLRPLAPLAYNMRWSWMPGGDELFASIDRERWQRCRANPVRLLLEASNEALEAAAADDEFLARMGELTAAVEADLARPDSTAVDGTVAFFCAEYGVHRSLPIYSGGLGALAGDILKQASDDALPVVAVGLMYREGYFRQRIDVTGWQQESWVDSDPDRLPMALITTPDGGPLSVRIPVGESDITAQVWEVRVGRVRLLLLDTDHPANDGVSRWITARLYVGDPGLRLAQYLVLGIGGMRALDALGIDPAVLHLNEGHAAFAALELAAREQRGGASLDEAMAAARARTVFTTHTPVPAGNDTYGPNHVAHAVHRAADEMGLGVERLVRTGRTNPDDPHEPFGVTQFALHTSRAANGVSARHGEVARAMWNGLWPDRSVEDVPITSVTNGVHLPTWVGGPIRHLLDRHLGEGWAARATDPRTWDALDAISDEELWDARSRQRSALISHVRERSVRERLARGDTLDYARAAAHFDPDALTIGFARRVATYKRIGLLLGQLDANLSLLAGDTPVQLLIAGKAHPRDEEAKHSLQELFSVRGAEGVSGRVAFLEDYDLDTAARLVGGCDVWVNLPRPPLEASGTSGMKSVVNGGLHLSVLDGWWAEAYDGSNGWALPGEVWEDTGAQDARDSAELHRLLADEVRPLFCDRGDDGIPHRWLELVRASMRTLAPRFGAGRMLEDYIERMYPARASTPR
ncbi:alpha-glucan family phosphorylase [Capillimicrobium parvum]|uniref:Glycogen phosphorylase n=1 Tax=Capillimicrobium parvum TaxID=2884022 RepID=A0A9E7C6E9_9ACTN|nr:alpha-glucan family phosphorylase [Capillimicrobium parvum]UGS38787.1 Glycogen phosphorylase [Capillimicrobium parvum]